MHPQAVVHASILGLSALALACPYSIQPWQPDVIVLICDYINYRSLELLYM